MTDDFKIVILAKFDKNNFSKKATVDIHGKPMIQHVFESAQASGASEIVIATGSPRVGMLAEDFGATVYMITDSELTGVASLADVVDKMGWDDETIVVNFPGDAPLTPGAIIKQVADNLYEHTEADSSVLYSMVPSKIAAKEYTVNLAVDTNGYVMYMSRMPLPHQSSADYEISEYKCSIEIYAYRAGLLRVFKNLPECDIDRAENIDELKLLCNGMKIYAAEANSLIGQRVITEDDVEKVKLQIAPAR
jgi:3-deoxy-manno-octulosonate cytidylyltransferase (CMP-KDO synthetase)